MVKENGLLKVLSNLFDKIKINKVKQNSDRAKYGQTTVWKPCESWCDCIPRAKVNMRCVCKQSEVLAPESDGTVGIDCDSQCRVSCAHHEHRQKNCHRLGADYVSRWVISSSIWD